MLNYIDSSEIIVYLVRRKFANRSSAVISMNDIIRLADHLTSSDTTIRVNISRTSLKNLSNYTNHLISYDNTEVRITDMRTPRMKFVMHQYSPTTKLVKVLNEVNI